MKYFIFSDIHGNIDALEVLLGEWERMEDSIPLCLGDMVGYGAAPNECVRAIQDLKIPTVMGNHEYAVFHQSERHNFNEYARVAIEWTAREITTSNRDYLQSLPYTLQVNPQFSLTHGDFSSPSSFHYIINLNIAQWSFSALTTTVGFFGHTHIPAVFVLDPVKTPDKQITGAVISQDNLKMFLPAEKRFLINPGSVGQPRDGDPRAAYLIFDPEEMSVQYRRLVYDWRKAGERIRNAGLPAYLTERLYWGY